MCLRYCFFIFYFISNHEILLEQRRDLKYTGCVKNAQLKNTVSLILFGWKEGKKEKRKGMGV
jgi:hypothetical protein